MAREVYLDYQSAKPVDPRVVEAMLPYFGERFGNPASLHSVGDRATVSLEESRAKVAEFIGAEPEEILFTSGATESNNLALLGYAGRNKRAGDHVVISEVEHISLHNIGKQLEKSGLRVTKVPPDQFGRICPEKLRARITDETILVSVCWASNEIGTVQPIPAIAEMLRGTGVALHVDAVAAEGLLPIDMSRSCRSSLLTLSSNDLYGPPGTGSAVHSQGDALGPGDDWRRPGARAALGHREPAGHRRAWPPPLASPPRRCPPRPRASPRCATASSRPCSPPSPTRTSTGTRPSVLPNNAHFRFEGVEGESLLLSLKDEGIAVSTGSACSSKTLEPSHTLISCGLLHEEAHGSLEFTFGRFSQESDVDRVMEVLPGSRGAPAAACRPLYKTD